jgi:hypothetical protein
MIDNSFFDYEEDYAIGYVCERVGLSNAKLKVVGIYSENAFQMLTPQEVKECFPPAGLVFAHNFPKDYEGLLVMIKVIPNTNTSRDDNDTYIWDKKGKITLFREPAIQINSKFSSNGQYNYSLLEKYGLIDVDEDKYVSSGDYIWHIEPKKTNRFVSYWNKNNVETINVGTKVFVIDTPQENQRAGSFDITNDDQLIDWFLSKVLEEEWSNLFENKNFKEVEDLIRRRLKITTQLTESAVENRIQRILAMTKTVNILYEKIQTLCACPWLKESIEKSLSEQKEAIRKEYEQSHIAEIKAAKKQCEVEINAEREKVNNVKSELEEQLSSKKNELKNIVDSIQQESKKVKELNDNIQLLKKHKESIVEDYSVVREVLKGGLTGSNTSQTERCFSLEEISIVQKECSQYQAFIKTLDDILCLNGIESEDACECIGGLLRNYRMLLVPDTKMAQIIIYATLCCRYMVEYVSATWRSFDDLWSNGLSYIVEQAETDAEKMYYLVLQNINLTYLPNYMMPLIDIQSGLTSKIAGTGKALPNNLRILCTITQDEVMPLNVNCLHYIGCVKRDWISVNHDKIEMPQLRDSFGYLSPKQLKESINDTITNYYEDYLQDE